MALDQSALLDLLGELKLTDVTDRIRVATETLYQELIDAEASAFIGAAPFERSGDRTTYRNGTRSRTLSTTAGDLDLKIPKLRAGSFFPALLERRRRVDQALFAVVMEAYVHGVSTRKVDDLVKALGADTGISKSEVSRICAGLDAEVAQFRDRTLAAQDFPYVFLDATYRLLRCREEPPQQKQQHARENRQIGDERRAPTDAEWRGVFVSPLLQSVQDSCLTDAARHQGHGLVIDELEDTATAHDFGLCHAAEVGVISGEAVVEVAGAHRATSSPMMRPM